MKQERFTELAQEALAASQRLVQEYQHNQWDVEHVLLALLQQERGLVGDVLNELKVNSIEVKRSVESALDKVPSPMLRGRYTPPHESRSLSSWLKKRQID